MQFFRPRFRDLRFLVLENLLGIFRISQLSQAPFTRHLIEQVPNTGWRLGVRTLQLLKSVRIIGVDGKGKHLGIRGALALFERFLPDRDFSNDRIPTRLREVEGVRESSSHKRF